MGILKNVYSIKKMAEIEDSKAARYRNVCFTLNDYTDQELTYLTNITSSDETVKYIVFQKETASSSGTKHLQGYCEFHRKIGISIVKKTLTGDKKSRIHIENRCGSAKRTADYCMDVNKRDIGTDHYEYGKMKKQGERKDLKRNMAEVVDDVVRSPVPGYEEWNLYATRDGCLFRKKER